MTNLLQKLKHKPAGTSLEEQMKTDFVTLSSHQLRTPLSAVKWFTEILLTERLGKLNKKQTEYLKEVYHSNERAIALVNDLLQVSRVQEGRIHLDLTKTSISSLVEEAIESHRALLASNKISFKLEIVNGPLPQLLIDKVKIRRVIQSILINALRYSPRGGNVEVILKKTDKEVVCSITDSGVGIPADEQDKIFGRFFRGSNVTKIEPDGTGLGLYIARALIDAHKGRIWFESQEGKGTAFYFSLPIRK